MAGHTNRERAIRRILRSRLPDRLKHRLSSPIVELTTGVASALVLLAFRMALIPVTGDLAPYAFVFLAVVGAAVLAGWRSGLVALVVGQSLTWYLVVGTPMTFAPQSLQQLGGFLVAILAQLLVLAVIALYQREVTRAMAEQDQKMDLLSEALREIDHRTKNNYQTVIALIQLQAQKSEHPEIRKALTEAAARIRAVSLASEQLGLRSEDLGTVRLGDHLRELCGQLKRGLASDDVNLHCDLSDVTTEPDTAIQISIIVNELVTNALKHAFDEGQANKEIRIRCAPSGNGVELVVGDNGKGIGELRQRADSGLGTQLIQRFVKELRADHSIESSDSGTTHRILVCSLA